MNLTYMFIPCCYKPSCYQQLFDTSYCSFDLSNSSLLDFKHEDQLASTKFKFVQPGCFPFMFPFWIMFDLELTVRYRTTFNF